MTIRPLSLLCLPALALVLAACGSSASTGSFSGEAHAAAQTIANLQSHAQSLEQKKICSQDLSSEVVAKLNKAPGGCEKAIESQIKQIDSFEANIEKVQVSGATATARVKSVHAGKKAVQDVTLVKQEGKWKIASIS